MTHPCEKKCSEYKGEQCKNCLIPEPEGVNVLDALNQILDELDGEGE